jgi:hypothetical protein
MDLGNLLTLLIGEGSVFRHQELQRGKGQRIANQI